MKKIIIILLTLTFLQACGEKAKLEILGNVNIEKTSAYSKMYLFQVMGNNLSKMDSAIIEENGDYHFKIKEEKNGIYLFGPNEMNLLTLILDENSKKVNVNIEDGKFISNNYSVSGAQYSEEIAVFSKKMNALRAEYMSKEVSVKRKNDIMSEILNSRGEFIKNHTNSPALIAVLGQINPNTEFELLKSTVTTLDKTIPNSAFLRSIKTDMGKLEQQLLQQKQDKIKQDLLMPIGSQAPELDFPNPEGKNIKLSSLKGKVVLIDFWASWCRPCRAANPHVVSLYNKYNKKGFEVYSFSLDKDKTKWEQAIIQDGLIWKSHTSDLLGWQTKAIEYYGFNGIPFTVLLDREGKVIAKGLRGMDLEKKLEEIL